MRLDKFIAQRFGVSRTVTGRGIRADRITVDGGIVKNSVFRLLPEHDVEHDGSSLVQQNGPYYFMPNKPQGYACSADDPDRPTVLYFLNEPVAYKLHATRRLDIDTTGLVLITDGGRRLRRITSSRHHCKKIHLVTLESPATDDAAEQLAHGVQLHNEKDLTKPAVLEVITSAQVRLITGEGRHHQAEHMSATVGNHVVEPHRE